MRGLCALAADLGARILVHGSPDQRKLETEARRTTGASAASECFAAVADAATLVRRHSIASSRCHATRPLSSTPSRKRRSIVRRIDSPAVRTMLDCSSAALTETESVPDLIRRWLPTGLIAHVHFNDPNRRGPGDGALDFAPILQALREVGYQGDAAIEPFIYEPDGPACAARGIGYIRKLMDAGA